MQTVLTIAGFDPSSGAGITADLMVFAAHGLFGTAAITALTVQSTQGVFRTDPAESELLAQTLDRLVDDLPPAGIKIGMLANEANVAAVVSFLARVKKSHPEVPVVLDPVLRSSSGRELLDPTGVTLLRSHLMPLVDWITPNLDELAILAEVPAGSPQEIMGAAYLLQKHSLTKHLLPNSLGIVVTCGDLNPPDDLLFVGPSDEAPIKLPGQRIPSHSTHGTGCAFSSALLSRLVLGDSAHDAALAAKRYVAEAIRTATPLGSGKGPLNHLWPRAISK